MRAPARPSKPDTQGSAAVAASGSAPGRGSLPATPTAGSAKTAPTKETKVPSLKLRAQLYPSILPGMRIEVRSRDVQGIYRVERVAHTGDTGGGDWQTEIEGKPL